MRRTRIGASRQTTISRKSRHELSIAPGNSRLKTGETSSPTNLRRPSHEISPRLPPSRLRGILADERRRGTRRQKSHDDAQNRSRGFHREGGRKSDKIKGISCDKGKLVHSSK